MEGETWKEVQKATVEKGLLDLIQKVNTLTEENKSLKAFEANIVPLYEKLAEFKRYVHDRLDKMGVPTDPEPENNAAHGCRIEGRLNFIEGENQKLREALEKWRMD